MRFLVFFLTLLLPLMGHPLAVWAQDGALPELLDARLLNTPERARLVLDLSAPTEFAIAALDMPDRIAVDVRVSEVKKPQAMTPAGNGIVSDYAIELAEAGRGRASLVLASPMQVQQAYVLDAFDNQPARLIVDFIPETAERFAKRVADDRAAALARSGATTTSTPPGQSNVQAQSRPLIVIDPGHGGIDGGAEAPNGVKEKDITLAFARDLQTLLEATGRFDVALTREDDSFLRLEERVALARDNKADLFISIHADSFQDSSVRGASLYTRDERATDILDKVLADSENRVDLIAGFAVPNIQDEVVDILVDLMRREMRRQSFVAAQSMIDHLQPSVRLRRFPMRQADFFVLQAPDVPSVLVELGFLSNTGDVSNLTKGEWQDRTAAALARGIAAYFDGMAQN